MKKIITLLASFILASSSTPTFNQIDSNTSLNFKFKNLKEQNNTNNFYALSNAPVNSFIRADYVSSIKNVLSVEVDSLLRKYFATIDGVYRTESDASCNWTVIKINGIDEPIAKITIAPNSDVYFTAISGNAYYLNHDQNEAKKINNIKNETSVIYNVLSVAIDSNNNVYFATDHGVYYVKNNNGYSWTVIKINGIDEPIAKITIAWNDSVYFASINNSSYYLENNSINAWNIGKHVSSVKNVWSVEVDSLLRKYFATIDGVYRTESDASCNWTVIKINGIDEPIAKITIAPNSDVYFTAISGNAYYLNHDQNEAKKINNIKNETSVIYNVLSVAIDSNNNVYFATDHGVYYVKNKNGYSWTVIKINGIDEPIAKITIAWNDSVYFKSFFATLITNKNKNLNISNIQQNNNPEIVIDNDDKQITESQLLHAGVGNAVNGMSRGFLNFVNSFYGTHDTINGVLNYLRNENIVETINNDNNVGLIRGCPFILSDRPQDRNNFFVVNIHIMQTETENRRLQLVFRRDNLYLQGFIIRNGNTYNSVGTYYHFHSTANDQVITNLNDPSIIVNTDLGFQGDYASLRALGTSISWNEIIQSFNNLLNYPSSNIREDLVRVIFSTSESWRFHHLYTRIAETSVENSQTSSFILNENEDGIFRTLQNWSTASRVNPVNVENITIGRRVVGRNRYVNFQNTNLIRYLSLFIALHTKRTI